MHHNTCNIGNILHVSQYVFYQQGSFHSIFGQSVTHQILDSATLSDACPLCNKYSQIVDKVTKNNNIWVRGRNLVARTSMHTCILIQFLHQISYFLVIFVLKIFTSNKRPSNGKFHAPGAFITNNVVLTVIEDKLLQITCVRECESFILHFLMRNSWKSSQVFAAHHD